MCKMLWIPLLSIISLFFFSGAFKIFEAGPKPEVEGVWAMAGVQGKVAFGLSHFCIEIFQKKF